MTNADDAAAAKATAETVDLQIGSKAEPGPDQRSVVRDRQRLHQAMIRRLNRRARIKGEVVYPCLPALRDEVVQRLQAVFAALGKPLDAKEIQKLRGLLGQQLEKGYANSGLSALKVTWWSDAAKDMVLHYRIQIMERRKAGQYEMWVKNRTPPLFGAHADARVMDLAAQLPAGARIVDLGAGTGRNAIPLAEAGYRVDTVDATTSFVGIVRKAAEEKGVSSRIDAKLGDILAEDDSLPAGAYQMVLLSEVVPDLRRLVDLRRIFTRADHVLAPGGYLLFNAFVTEPDFQPDPLTLELSQYNWCWLLTRANLAEVSAGLSLELESDLEAYPYERARQPTWPPTGWYDNWSHGNDLFGLGKSECGPVALRWLTYRKKA